MRIFFNTARSKNANYMSFMSNGLLLINYKTIEILRPDAFVNSNWLLSSAFFLFIFYFYLYLAFIYYFRPRSIRTCTQSVHDSTSRAIAWLILSYICYSLKKFLATSMHRINRFQFTELALDCSFVNTHELKKKPLKNSLSPFLIFRSEKWFLDWCRNNDKST